VLSFPCGHSFDILDLDVLLNLIKVCIGYVHYRGGTFFFTLIMLMLQF